ncbi:uncharacterized protein BDW43DRAFT_316729 [Aspergillus alliaceus]|uniref:uncharacterized protein n=1 Tax=Petromyces alliaceus TaxID=209559 RepID=UPI0012A66451|nr:uncharacterized protein BDW43DRAFT_316729 [Aspergillus alliaceus]KAB8227555.1 hypothetical protein BDW43DRAFT_316729 [Aspergillus alliaceus]
MDIFLILQFRVGVSEWAAVESEILAARGAAATATADLAAALNSLQLVGPLRGPAGARVSPMEQRSGLMLGSQQLKDAASTFEEAAEKLRAALAMITGS